MHGAPEGQCIHVALARRPYSVHVGEKLLESSGVLTRQCFPKLRRIAILADSTVAKLYGKRLAEALRRADFAPELLDFPAGESSKSLSIAEDLCERMIRLGFDRSCAVAALGGGVTGDLAGFVAAIYYRGVPFIQVPTTVVAQVDSAVGGKTGVNARSGKNLIGAFHQPSLVIADVSTLETLEPRDFNEGFAEIIKHAIIRDPALFDRLFDAPRGQALTHVIATNVSIKARIVEEDEFETSGVRALLNFGHTIGHGIEAAAGYGTYRHGEAVSLGMVAAARLSQQQAGLDSRSVERIMELLRKYHLPTQLNPAVDRGEIMKALLTDKKFAEGRPRFVLTREIGSAFVSDEITLKDIENAINGLYGPESD
jgi:3-dehydroquinate synthase